MTSLCESLRANADLTEKALDFMADPEQIEESKADIALWREAANEIERLHAECGTLTRAYASVAQALNDATEALDRG